MVAAIEKLSAELVEIFDLFLSFLELLIGIGRFHNSVFRCFPKFLDIFDSTLSDFFDVQNFYLFKFALNSWD